MPFDPFHSPPRCKCSICLFYMESRSPGGVLCQMNHSLSKWFTFLWCWADVTVMWTEIGGMNIKDSRQKAFRMEIQIQALMLYSVNLYWFGLNKYLKFYVRTMITYVFYMIWWEWFSWYHLQSLLCSILLYWLNFDLTMRPVKMADRR